MKIKVLVSLRTRNLTVRLPWKRVSYERVRFNSCQLRVALQYLRTSLTFVHICLTVNKLGKKTDNQNTIKAQRRLFHSS